MIRNVIRRQTISSRTGPMALLWWSDFCRPTRRFPTPRVPWIVLLEFSHPLWIFIIGFLVGGYVTVDEEDAGSEGTENEEEDSTSEWSILRIFAAPAACATTASQSFSMVKAAATFRAPQSNQPSAAMEKAYRLFPPFAAMSPATASGPRPLPTSSDKAKMANPVPLPRGLVVF